MRFAMSSRSSTERLGDFLKAYVSHCVLGVSLGCLVFFGCCWVCLFVLLLRHLAFCSHLQSNKSIDDRLSFERARHEPKKKVRYWNHPPKKGAVLSLSSRVVGFLGSFARASSKFRRAFILNKKRPNTFLQTMVVTSGGLVAAAKFFRYVSFLLIPLSDHNGFHERVLKHSYIASSMCAMTRQTQLHSIQHVCKDKTNTVA